MQRTVVKKVREKEPDMEVIRQAGQIIRSGGLVAFPTETVYGLGADALQPEASKKYMKLKEGRRIIL